ncbi:MAG: hypothetical protein ACRDZO_15460, partial [Egibacteraceae bacterium]
MIIDAERFFEENWTRILVNQPPAVRAHLDAQRQLARELLTTRRYDLVIEVGCADGSLLMPTIVGLGRRYLGVEIAKGAVDDAGQRLAAMPRRPGQRAEVVHGDIRHLDAIAAESDLVRGSVLVAFPFNVFGNIVEPRQVLATTAAHDLDVLIITYDTSPAARDLRAEYYRACGLSGDFTTGATGARFASGPFTSSVYHPSVLRRWLTLNPPLRARTTQVSSGS